MVTDPELDGAWGPKTAKCVLAVLQNAAARLGTSQSDESARQALLDVRKQLAGMRQRAAGPSKVVAPPGGGAATETPEQRIQRLLGGGG